MIINENLLKRTELNIRNIDNRQISDEESILLTSSLEESNRLIEKVYRREVKIQK